MFMVSLPTNAVITRRRKSEGSGPNDASSLISLSAEELFLEIESPGKPLHSWLVAGLLQI
jgi:hypothetical protein